MNPKMLISGEEVEVLEDEGEQTIDEMMKFKISWKNILKVVIILIILAIVVYYSIIGVFPSDIFVYIVLIVCIVGGALLIGIGTEEEENNKTISSLNCSECSYTEINWFDDGDYVFKIKKKCPNCTKDLQIANIHSIKLAEPKNGESV